MEKVELSLRNIEQMFCKSEGILSKFTDTSINSIREWLIEKGFEINFKEITEKNLNEFLKEQLKKGIDIRYYFDDCLNNDKDFNYNDTEKDFLEYVNNLYEEEIKEFLK